MATGSALPSRETSTDFAPGALTLKVTWPSPLTSGDTRGGGGEGGAWACTAVPAARSRARVTARLGADGLEVMSSPPLVPGTIARQRPRRVRLGRDMDREEAAQALELLSRVVRQARDDTAVQNWGAVWMVHGVTNGLAFAATGALL